MGAVLLVGRSLTHSDSSSKVMDKQGWCWPGEGLQGTESGWGYSSTGSQVIHLFWLVQPGPIWWKSSGIVRNGLVAGPRKNLEERSLMQSEEWHPDTTDHSSVIGSMLWHPNSPMIPPQLPAVTFAAQWTKPLWVQYLHHFLPFFCPRWALHPFHTHDLSFFSYCYNMKTQQAESI